MRILVHDFSGHPFQAQLARRLAQRGHDVLHVSCPSYATGKGAIQRLPLDPTTFGVRLLGLRGEWRPYSYASRVLQEFEYGLKFVRLAAGWKPDVVLSSNVPLFAHLLVHTFLWRMHVPQVFWHQDVYSRAMSSEAARKLPAWLGIVMGKTFVAMERYIARNSAAVVAISDDFLPVYDRWRVGHDRVSVIENWAPLEELPLRARDNLWAVRHGLDDKFVFLYSGTLGLKHNPQLLWDVATHFRCDAGVRVVVVSSGRGKEWLRDRLREDPLEQLVLLPYQPYADLPDVLAAADVLLVVLEPDAGGFSVPSKVLTALCAGRPILGALPPQNLAAQTIRRARAGIVVDPTDFSGWLAHAGRLRVAQDLDYGENARQYAETTFDGDRMAAAFEAVLEEATQRAP